MFSLRSVPALICLVFFSSNLSVAQIPTPLGQAVIPVSVKSGDNPRRASFLARMGNMAGPMEKDGKPTRLALALKAWGASSKEDARSKAKNISERNK